MTQDTKAIMRRFYDEVINGRNLDLIDELTTPDFIEHEEFPGLASGREGVKQFFSMMRTAFPDFRMNVEDMIAEGDKAVVRATLTGTHRGDFMGIPATGKSISVTVIDIVCFSGGKVAEHWGVSDTAGMMEQLGVAPLAV
jgi:steroid delta-isomerase-like uncharacterized protein